MTRLDANGRSGPDSAAPMPSALRRWDAVAALVPGTAVGRIEPGRLEVLEALAVLVSELVRSVEALLAELPPAAKGHATYRDECGPLTPRQREVLARVAEGCSTQEIAADLCVSTTTVRNHIAKALPALGAHSRVQAVAHARRRGLLP